jgi:hypothetical protein
MKPLLRRSTQLVLLAATVWQLQGCGFLGVAEDGRGNTLEALADARMPNTKVKVAVIDMERVEQSYHRALAVAEEPALRQQILVRLADLEMARSEQAQLNATDVRGFYDKPIAMYSELLKIQNENPNRIRTA